MCIHSSFKCCGGILIELSEKARALILEFESYLPASAGSDSTGGTNGLSDAARGPWLFGLENPTALNARLVIFIGRMRDVGRHELIPLRVLADMQIMRLGMEGTDAGKENTRILVCSCSGLRCHELLPIRPRFWPQHECRILPPIGRHSRSSMNQ
jgi:hypothetical protein